MSVNCPECKVENSDLAKFCKGCGFNLQTAVIVPEVPVPDGIACGECGSINNFGAKFCKACGTPTTVVSPAAVLATPENEPGYSLQAVPELTQSTCETLAAESPSPVAVSPDSAPIEAEAIAELLDPQPSGPAAAQEAPGTPTVPTNAIQRKKTSYPLLLGIAAISSIGLAGGIYWTMTGGTHTEIPSAAAAVQAPANPSPSPINMSVETAPAPVHAPTSTLTQSPAANTEASKPPPPPVQPADAPAVTEKDPAPATPVVTQPEPQGKPVLVAKPSQRTADEAAVQQRAARQAAARQKEQDRVKLNNAHKTLDDLLK